MIRWLKIMRAEVVRDVTITLRYPLELFTGVLMLYIFFMGLFMGARLLAGNQALSGNLDGVVIGYTMWFFAMMALNTMSTDIESEARQGTLEQVYLHAPSYLSLLWVRGFVHLCLGAGLVVVLATAIQATTGHWLALTWGKVPLLILVVFLTVLGLSGFGLVLGGFSLVFKRIGQLSALVQFGLFFLAYTELSTVPLPWRNIVAHLPLARGVDILKLLVNEDVAAAQKDLGMLVIDAVLYALVGSLVFYLMDRVARKGGMLSHY
jgi:ABC-2 type transport system permease protein